MAEDPDRRQMRDDIFVTEAVPHDWLYPRCAMAIHHGGSGATAASMRAGIPTVIVPFLWDQLFWGRRADALGVGPRPILQTELSGARLGDAIGAALTPAMQERAARLGRRLHREDGIAAAVDVLERTVEAGRGALLR